MFSFILIALSSVNAVSAGSSVIYVNGSGGNDDWNGQAAVWDGIGTNGPKKSVKSGITAVSDGGTVNIADGRYLENSIEIRKNVNIKGQSTDGTIIDGNKKGNIFFIGDCRVNIHNLTFINGNTTRGGAINNYGTTNVSGCKFINNTAAHVTITDDGGCGGAICNAYGNTYVYNSTFTGNTANSGAAVANIGSDLYIKGCIFFNNRCTGHYTSLIYNGGSFDNSDVEINFNSFIMNDRTLVHHGTYHINARYNFWGYNYDPNWEIPAYVDYQPWIVFNVNAPSTVLTNTNSAISVDLLHDNYGNYIDPSNGHVPDGIPFTFSTTLGTIDNHAYTVNGIAKATFNCDIPSTATIKTSVTETVFINSYVTAVTDTTNPTVTANHPSGTYNNVKTMTLTATDNFDQNPEIYYSTNNGITWNYKAKIITLNLNQGKTVLMFFARDWAGNQCPTQIVTYNIDTITPKIVATSPKNGAIKVSRTAKIAIKLSEKIKASINWSKIVVKNRYGKAVSITKQISGNMLYIKTNSKRSSYSYYTVYIPKSAVKDYAGNNFAGYTFKFKTGKY